jgi:hypothetical protein
MFEDKSVLDRFLIRELIERYSYSVNARDWSTMADCFTENGTWDVGPPFNFKPVGRAAISSLVREKIAENDFVQQMPHATMIWLDGDKARAHTTVQEWVRAPQGKGGIQLLGTYVDAIVRDGADWRFSSRVFRIVNLLLEAPPGEFYK